MNDDGLTLDELNISFGGINKALGIEFIQELKPEELNKQISEEFSSIIGDKETTALINSISGEVRDLSVKTEQISNALTTARIQDAEFLEREMKSVMLSSRRVLETVEKNIKIGASPRDVEVYSGLITAITGQFKELRNLNESMAKFVLENKKQNLEEVKEDHKMMLSSNDALDMYMNARTNSQMSSIDADFDIVDD
jgi:hypothetical protein